MGFLRRLESSQNFITLNAVPRPLVRPQLKPCLGQPTNTLNLLAGIVTSHRKVYKDPEKASYRLYQQGTIKRMIPNGHSGGPGRQTPVSIPGLTMLSRPQPSAALNTSQSSTDPSSIKGRKSKHAQRIAAAAAVSKQSTTSAAEIRSERLSQAQQGGIPAKLVENDPQWQNDNSRPRTAPSRASGGVPDPSTQYLAQTLFPSVTLASPRRILVIIDLNGTLLYRPSRRRPFDFVVRPHAQDFLSYCLDTFYVAIWSSARPDNVRKMVAQLLSPQQVKRCVIVWARDRFGLDASDYDARVQCYKRLARVWADPAVQASCPIKGGKWDQSNTVLVDDSMEKGRSEPFNILALPEFSGLENEAAEVLPQVHDYLNTLCGQSDISSYMRRNQFRLDPDYVLPP